MATRLTKEIRKKILLALLNHRFKEEQEKVLKDLKLLEVAVYKDIYPEKIRKAMAVLPEGYLPTGGQLRVIFGGEATQIYVHDAKPVSATHLGYSTTVKNYDANDAFTMEWRRIMRTKSDLAHKRDQASAMARGVMQNCNTFKQLVEAWPEVLPFVSDYMTKPAACVALTVPIKELNAQFKL